jgi:hypothetical protein
MNTASAVIDQYFDVVEFFQYKAVTYGYRLLSLPQTLSNSFNTTLFALSHMFYCGLYVKYNLSVPGVGIKIVE